MHSPLNFESNEMPRRSPDTTGSADANPVPIGVAAQPANAETRSGSPEPERARMPAWWNRALELEAQSQLEAAESVIREGCQHIGFAASTAEMYRGRMNRLKAAGDRAGALEAFKRSGEFMRFYASMATSGGEGAALSRERDEFRAQLVAEFGSDPDACGA